MADMFAIVMSGFGEPSDLAMGKLPMPVIGEGDLLVRVAAVAINPVDWKEVAGMLEAFYPPYPQPWVPAFDASGVVKAVGSAATDFHAGDRVMIRPDRTGGHGVLAEYATVPADKAARIPASLNHAQAASAATALRTAYQALQREDIGALRAGQTVVVDGAAGGVGSYAVALAKYYGANVAATCRPEHAEYVRALGAAAVFDYRDADLHDRLAAWAPEGIDVILDCASGGQKTDQLDLLAPGGRLIALATLNNDGDVAGTMALAAEKGRHFHFLLLDYDRLPQDMAALLPVLESGDLPLPEIAQFEFADTAAAFEAVKRGGVRGKVVVKVADLS